MGVYERKGGEEVPDLVYAELNCGGLGGFDFRISDFNKLQGWFGAGATALTGTTTLSASTWHMATFAWNTSGKEIFLDGVSDGISTTAETMTAGAANLYVGNGVSNPTQYFNGITDECGIWNRVLSQSEITALYNSGAGLQHPF